MKFTRTVQQVRKVVCGISGGVDSAVSALKLKLKGYEVIGVFMKNWDASNEHGVCTADIDREDAKFVCDHLKIPFVETNFVKEYWNEVFCAFLNDLNQGKTPNPDVLCNKYIKFDALHKFAIQNLGADAVATGHYVRTSVGYDLDSIDSKKGVDLLTAVDQAKCQTLFLSQIPQQGLQRALFPVGDMLKEDVKQLARESGMERIANRKESMGICFIGKRHFHDFIEDYIEPKPGNFVNLVTGEIVGQHKGLHYFTRGQRTLIGGLGEAMFVAEKDMETNDILVVQGTDHPALFCQTIFTEECHWINKPPRKLLTEQMYDCEFKYQHVHPPMDCTVTLSGGNSLIVSLPEPLRALTAGQYAVLYDGDVCLGSAKIRRPGPSLYTLGHSERVKNYPT